MDDYTEQKVNEALFDHHDEEVHEQQETEVPEQQETEVPEQQETEVPEQQETEVPEQQETEMPNQQETEMQEPTLDDLLSELNGVKKEKWQALMHFNTTELKEAFEKEGEVRESLKKMNWW